MKDDLHKQINKLENSINEKKKGIDNDKVRPIFVNF